jgi:hypothetical protein
MLQPAVLIKIVIDYPLVSADHGTKRGRRRSLGEGEPAMTDKSKKGDPKAGDDGKKSDVDRQSEDSFPASDPPSYAGGKHIIGEPPRPDKHDKKASSN